MQAVLKCGEAGFPELAQMIVANPETASRRMMQLKDVEQYKNICSAANLPTNFYKSLIMTTPGIAMAKKLVLDMQLENDGEDLDIHGTLPKTKIESKSDKIQNSWTAAFTQAGVKLK